MKTPSDWKAALSTPAVELRRAPRKRFTAALDVTAPAQGSCRGVACDLSVGGIGAIVFADGVDFADLQVGDTVVIGYEHPNPERVKAVARSARVQGRYGNRYGFLFDEPMPIA